MRDNLLKSTTHLSAMTFLSRLLGFVRDIVIAQVFGATGAVDAFFVAFKIPNFMRRLFTEGALSQALVPVITQQKEQSQDVRLFFSHLLGGVGLALLVVTIMAQVGAPLLISLFAPGFIQDPGRYPLGIDLLRLTTPYVLLISLTALCGALQNAYSCFLVPAMTPILLNLCLVVAALFCAPFFEQRVMALGWGVFLAGVLQLLFQLPFLAQLKLLAWPRFTWQDKTIWRLIKGILPAVFGVSVVQISIFLESIYASFLPVGSISWLYYADRMTALPLGIFGVAITTAILPSLAQQACKAKHADFFATLDWGFRLILLIACPAAAALLILAEPILITLLYHGQFDAHSVQNTAKAVQAFAVGIPVFMLIKLFASACYAKQKVAIVVKIALFSLAVSIIASLLLMHPFLHSGLAFATSLAAFVNASLLMIWLVWQQHYQPTLKLHFLFSLSGALVVLIALLWLGMGELNLWYQWSNTLRIARLMVLCCIGTLGYFVTLYLLGLRWHHLTLATEPAN